MYCTEVPAGSPYGEQSEEVESCGGLCFCGGNVAVYVFDDDVFDINRPGLPTPFFYSVVVSILALWPFQLYFIP